MKKYVKTPTIYQVEATECGATCLSMIFACFGKHMSQEKMRMETGVSRDGCNAGNLMRTAKRYGMECHGYRKDASALKQLEPPCILHWEYNHFVVYEGYKGKYAYINDPAAGRRKLKDEELKKGFTGVVLTFHPTDEFQKSRRQDGVFSYVKQKCSGCWKDIVKLVTVDVLSVIPVIMFAFLLQRLLDKTLSHKAAECLLPVSLAVLLLQAVLVLHRMYIQDKLQKKMVLLSSYRFLYKLFRLPLEFFELRSAGELVERTEENERTAEFVAGDAWNLLFCCIESVIYAVLLFYFCPLLSIAVMTVYFLELIGMKLAEGSVSGPIQKLKQDYGRLAGMVFAGLRLTETIKTAGAEKVYAHRLLSQNKKITAEEKKVKKYQRLSSDLSGLLLNLLRIGILIFGAYYVAKGKMTPGFFAAFFLLAELLAVSVKQGMYIYGKMQNIKFEMQRTEDIKNYAPSSKSGENGKNTEQTTKLEGAVELRNVSFGYSRLKPPTIKNINVRVGCGDSVAVLGTTGCGKSTVAKLVGGLYEPWSGTVFFDGMAAESIPKNILSASVATVSPEQTLFAGSIRDNITMWNSNISETDMIQAATDACIHEDILTRPEGYEFMLTEEATNLSGGQKQRVRIARALATNPTVLILDEATSALDGLLEKRIMDNIKRRGCTCIVIAHRFSAIRDCDRIFVLDDGKIVQRGSHKELWKEEGIYKRLMGSL